MKNNSACILITNYEYDLSTRNYQSLPIKSVGRYSDFENVIGSM